jgi:CubicO group peptidase (beta-lactamase class C family)
VRVRLITRSRVPKDLESVTSIDRGAEVDPRDVDVKREALDAVWTGVQRVYRSGIHPAIQLCVRRHGRVILQRAIGHASGNGPHDPPQARKVPVTPETPFNIFSASKAVTAMLIHLLDQRHLVHLNDAVCEYIPEFGVKKKQWITIQHVLSHRAGIPNLPREAMNLERLGDPQSIVRMLCEAEPALRPGRDLAYHAITGGFILGEIVRRVTGKGIDAFLRHELQQPLGFRWMRYGVRPSEVKKVALNYFTGPPAMPPVSTLLLRALGAPFQEVTRISNDPRFLTGVIPSGNVCANADELCRFYQMLLNGGELDGVRIFEPRTIRRALTEQSYLEFDLTLGVPLRYGLGFMLGGKWFSLYGPDTQHAFGHLGFTNILSWADPERQLSAALMTNGKPLVYPELYYLWDLVRQIGRACPKAKRRAAVVPVTARTRQRSVAQLHTRS